MIEFPWRTRRAAASRRTSRAWREPTPLRVGSFPDRTRKRKSTGKPFTATWTEIAVPSTGFPEGVVYNSVLALWCVVGQTKYILTSPDGAVWTQRTAPAGGDTTYIRVVAGEAGLFLTARGTNNVDYSSDGTSWTSKTLNQVTAVDQARALAYSPYLDRWTAVCDANAEQSYTSDATGTWTNRFGSITASEVIWDDVNNIFVYASGNNNIVTTSPDATTTFNICTNPGTKGASDQGDAIAWDGVSTYIVALGPNGPTSTSRMWINTSGNPTTGTWSDVTHPFGAHKIKSIAYSPLLKEWRACSNGGLLASSPNGTTWTLVTLPGSPAPAELLCVAWSADLQQFIAVGWNTTPAGRIYVEQ